MDLAAILDGLLANVGRSDIAAQRAGRLRALPNREKKALGSAVEALDRLLASLDEREASVAGGEVTPPDPEAEARAAAEAAAAAEAEKAAKAAEAEKAAKAAEAEEAARAAEAAKAEAAAEAAEEKSRAAKERAEAAEVQMPEVPAEPAPEIVPQRFDSAEELIESFDSQPVMVSEEAVPIVTDDDLAATRLDLTPVSRLPIPSGDVDATRQNLPKVPKQKPKPDSQVAPKPRAFHEAPTMILGALTDEVISRAAELGLDVPDLAVTRDDRPQLLASGTPPDEAPPAQAETELPEASLDSHGEISPPELDDEEELGIDAFEETAAGDDSMLADAAERLAVTTLPPDIIQDDEATPGWTRPAELLFDDALRLFRLGDSDGALISLERLLATMELNDDLHEFIRVNEDRLLDLYHAIIGPWDKIPIRPTENDEPMPLSFLQTPKIDIVLQRVDGRTTMETIMQLNSMTRLETVAVLSQLMRAKTITTEA